MAMISAALSGLAVARINRGADPGNSFKPSEIMKALSVVIPSGPGHAPVPGDGGRAAVGCAISFAVMSISFQRTEEQQALRERRACEGPCRALRR
jgi:hypothetical protein